MLQYAESMTENNKRKLLVAAITTTIIPAILVVRYPSIVSLKSIALYLSAITGYAGITILLWSYILGAKSVMGIVFRDLSPVLSIHKWLGKYGTLAIFAHPLLVMYSYGVNLLYTFVPVLSTKFERHVTLGRLSFIILIVIWVTSALIRGKIKFRPWRYIHVLGYIMLPFVFLHVPDVGSQFMHHDIVKAYYIGLLMVFFAFSLVRLRGLLGLDKTSYKIVSHRQLVNEDPSVWLLQLRPTSDRIIPAKGQYVYVKDGLVSEDHPFSVLDYNAKTGDITIAYRTFGRFTTELSTRPIGAQLLLGGPYGAFTYEIETENTPVVFVAGGIGVTPMVRYLLNSPAREQWMFYANRTKQSAIIIPELRKLLGARLITAFSRQTDGLEIGDEHGHLTGEIFQRHLEQPSKYHYYLCGSDKMMQDTAAELIGIGVPTTSIRREAFSW